MEHLEESGLRQARPPAALLVTLIAATLLLTLAAAIFFDQPFLHQSLFRLANLVGPTTQSLLNGGGLTVCTPEMGTPGNPICFHAGRMPLPSLVIALGIRLFGNSFFRVAIFKTLLFLLPIEFSIVLVWLRTRRDVWRQRAVCTLLLFPFFVTSFLANAVNLQVEEAYTYSLLALAVALLFFMSSASFDSPGWVCLFAVTVDALYLSKSSMALAVSVLAVAFMLHQRRTASRLLLITLVAAAPLGWALHQHHASGRYSLGTSLDGINLHKANAEGFLDHYPPPPGSSLDQYDADLNRGRSFPDEWSFNDFHTRAAIAFFETHPRQTLASDGRKFDVFFFSLTKYGSSASHGLQLAIETAGLLIFRLVLWAALGSSVVVILNPARATLRRHAWCFLALVAACATPYMAGFAYTRHASILLYPSCLLCCRLLCDISPQRVRSI